MESGYSEKYSGKIDVLCLFLLCCSLFVLLVVFFQDAINWSHHESQFTHLVKTGSNPDKLADWRVKKIQFRRPTNEENSITVSSIEYLSKRHTGVYGIPRINESRSKKLGFTRRLKRYKRSFEVSVPELISENTVHCDSWMKESSQSDESKLAVVAASRLQECVIEDNDSRCFKCVESQRFIRSCIQVASGLTLTRKDGTEFIIPPNRAEKYGWCLPSNFKHWLVSGSQTGPIDSERQCNPNTGTWLLSQLGDDNGDNDLSFNWICKCRYPNLMSNLTTLTSDCLRPVGCGENGRLDDSAAKGLIDPYREGSCICDYGYTSDWDKTVGPTCSRLSIGHTGALEDIYKQYHISFGKRLRHDFISPTFLSLFDEKYSNITSVPDPCKVDALTGFETNGCQATQWMIDNKWVVFCQSTQTDHVAIKTSTDYLLNNYGRYPNACAKIYESNDLFMVTGAANIPMNLSFVNGKNQPDVGMIIFDNVPSNLRRLYNALWKKDANLRAWYHREMKPTKVWNNKRFELYHNLNKMADEETIVVYEDHPNGRQTQQTYLHKLLYAPFSDSSAAAEYEKTFILYGQHYNRYFREYYGVKDYWWWDQYLDQYNESSDWGRVPDGAMYTKYIAQSGDINKQNYRMTIIHHRFSGDDEVNAKHAQYPAIPKKCIWCGDYGSLTSDYVREWIIPSLYVCLYQNKFLPIQINRKYFSFDGTVTLYKTAKMPDKKEKRKFEIFIFSERFVGNFRGYHQKGLDLVKK